MIYPSNSIIYLPNLFLYIYLIPNIEQHIFFWYIKQKSMTKFLLALLFSTLLISCQAAPLKALLYCYLPAVNTSNTTSEYNKLASMVNQKLQAQKIDVRVQVCNSEQGGKLYNADQITSLFDDYDIVQVDVSYLWAVKTDLLSFSKDEIDYQDKVFEFQWTPVTKRINGTSKLIGSPGLLCSNFIETRKGDYQNRLYSDFSEESAYGLVTLYMSTFINLKPSRTLKDVNYNSVDPQTIQSMAEFLKKCQDDDSTFFYYSNWCLQPLNQSFFSTNYSQTIGYSQNLFNFINAGIDPSNIEIQQIAYKKPKKVFYADEFVAKNTADPQNKKTILDFYKFMLSDEIIDIYVNGLYTDKPQKTYLIPPTIDYMNRLVKDDRIYKQIYETAFVRSIQLPIYERNFAENVYHFAKLINQALRYYDPYRRSGHSHRGHHFGRHH